MYVSWPNFPAYSVKHHNHVLCKTLVQKLQTDINRGDAIAEWLVCSTSVREIRVRVSLAAGGRIATVGQLLFAPWAWAYSTLHP